MTTGTRGVKLDPVLVLTLTLSQTHGQHGRTSSSQFNENVKRHQLREKINEKVRSINPVVVILQMIGNI